MKLAEHANSLETNVQNSQQSFGIGNASVVIDILRKHMYGNPKQTLVQEYICNARDAMREVGKGNAFEITVPTHLSPVFKVRDFGPGITEDRMANVFILYGASTKRDTNNQTGGFGIGAKSAWAYTDSFTIVTVVNGEKRSYVAHTGVDNNGRLDLISKEKTTEKNGTEIQIAVQRNDINEFCDAVRRAIYFWDEKPTLKGTLDQAPTLVKGLSIGNTFEVIESRLIPSYVGDNWSTTPTIIIDGIPYHVGQNLLNHCPTLAKLSGFIRLKPIFHIGNGVVEVNSSRESIADSTKSKEALEKLATKVFMEVRTHIGDQFKGVKSTSEYFERYQTLNKAFNVEKGFAQYKDYQINGEYIQSALFADVAITEIHCMGKYGKNRVDKITKEQLLTPAEKKIPLKSFDSLFFISEEESLVSQNKRIRVHFEKKDRMFLIHPIDGKKLAFKKLVKDLDIKDFSALTYVVLPKEARVKIPREKTQFCLHTVDHARHTYTTLSDNADQWLYALINKDGYEYPLQDLKDLGDYMKEVHGTRVCAVAERAHKMIQGDKNFSPLTEWYKNYKPTQKELNYAKFLKAHNKEHMELLADASGIKDVQLMDLIKEYKTFANAGSLEPVPEMLLKKLYESKEIKEFVKEDEEVNKLIKRSYPLIASVGRYAGKTMAQELAHYINAKYKESK